GGARLRPHLPGGHLRSGLSADRGGAAVRRHAIAEQDPPHQHHSPLTGAARNMTTKLQTLETALQEVLGDKIQGLTVALGEITVVVKAADYADAMRNLRDHARLRFEQLIDLCGVD